MTALEQDDALVIESVETYLVQPPIRHTGKLGVGAFTHAESVIVRIRTRGGIEGVGEASLWAPFTDNAYATKETLDRYLVPAVIGKSVADIESITVAMEAANFGASSAKAAIDIACFDATGKAFGVSVSALLGGRVRESVNLSYSVTNQDIPKDLAEIDWLLERGFKTLKIKTGVLNAREEVARLAAIREHVGDDYDLRIDFNQGLQPEGALRLCRELEQFNFTFIEQPLRGWNLDGMRAIAAALDTPIVADESVRSLQDAMKVANTRAADIISIKLMKVSGLLQGKKVAAVCEAAGLACTAGAMWESGIGIAASLHLSCSSPVVRYGSDYYTAQYLLEDDLLLEPLKVSDGDIFVPEGPGLGVEVDWAAIDRHRLS